MSSRYISSGVESFFAVEEKLKDKAGSIEEFIKWIFCWGGFFIFNEIENVVNVLNVIDVKNEGKWGNVIIVPDVKWNMNLRFSNS